MANRLNRSRLWPTGSTDRGYGQPAQPVEEPVEEGQKPSLSLPVAFSSRSRCFSYRSRSSRGPVEVRLRQRSGSQQSNASNGSQIGVEMKKLEPMEADHSKLKANFAGLRNQPLAAKSAFGCEMISQPSCSSAKFRSHFVRLRNSPECFQIFATIVFCYFASDICCLNANSLLVTHQLDDSLVVEQGCRETETIVEMITRFTDIVNGLQALGKTYEESEKVMKILRFSHQSGIPRKLNKYMKDERFRGRKFTSRRDPSKKESSSHGDKEKWDEKIDLTCFKCKKPGHIKYDCPLYKSKAKRRMKKATMATWSESEESSEEENEKEVANMCFMAIDDLDEGSKKDKWFLDSGCSRHMTRDESKFVFLKKRNGGYVTFGDNSKGRIIGQGNIGNGTSSLIESVLLVGGLKYNFLSISQLCEKGFKVIFEASHCIIEDIQNDKTIFMGHRCDNVYAINISKYDGHDKCFSSMHDQNWLWHRRLGHANIDLISQLNKDELVRGLPKINFLKDKVCEAC
uniref:CCHC-type domain-containing protein n=1 Tax=Vitis vinifera TaxID=29760 RepID=A5AKH3_VITVI|nr:hypothetical protein VITISV_008481 [Vitis vinifera]